MNSTLKDIIRNILVKLPIALTKNIKYDQLTTKIIRKVCIPTSNCIDVGCHKGEVMDIILSNALQGQHFGFEPIPYLADQLRQKYSKKPVTILEYALSDKVDQSSFNLVESNPAYSGLKKRDYDKAETDRSITVSVDKLDNLIPTEVSIDLIKIDVEGGELGVLSGAIETIRRSTPVILFEHGKGASEHYSTSPNDITAFMNQLGYSIYLLDAFLYNQRPLSDAEFIRQYEQRMNYYFVAKSQV